MDKDIAESRTIKERNNYEYRMCYKNAFMSMGEVPESLYVEGYYIIEIGDTKLPIEHGWLRKPDGTIVDPTLPEDNGVYVEAKAWTLDEALNLLTKRPVLPLLSMRDEELRDAMEQALEIIERSR